MSSFEPNAVIRGFQLTVVGSMSPYMFCFYLPIIQGDWFKMSRNPWLHKKIPSMSLELYSVGVGLCQDSDQGATWTEFSQPHFVICLGMIAWMEFFILDPC